ncbi:hypothetical protein [Rhizobium sp. OAE497]|uniref:DUF6894 family protein n=1 Tax=Rhizobium sp. OAE497 TaxID=2663796 RepID=UPI0018F34928
MTKYFFGVRHEGYLVEDREGSDFPSRSEARAEALEILRDLIADTIQSRSENFSTGVELVDADGTCEIVSTIEAIPALLNLLATGADRRANTGNARPPNGDEEVRKAAAMPAPAGWKSVILRMY